MGTILKKWYILFLSLTFVVTYWVFNGLHSAGVINNINKTIIHSFTQVKSVAQNCTPLIKDIYSFWNCTKNPPQYNETSIDEEISKRLSDIQSKESDDLKVKHMITNKNPYE